MKIEVDETTAELLKDILRDHVDGIKSRDIHYGTLDENIEVVDCLEEFMEELR